MQDTNDSPKPGDLRLWWIPQVPSPTFQVSVASFEEAVGFYRLLAAYDLFGFQSGIKPDYANAGGPEIYTESGWEEWFSEDGEEFSSQVSP